jgi:hypothetical protein
MVFKLCICKLSMLSNETLRLRVEYVCVRRKVGSLSLYVCVSGSAHCCPRRRIGLGKGEW